jgi:hypothetical protein
MDAEDCLERAEDCETMAETVTGALRKKMLSIARTRRKLAANAPTRGLRRPPTTDHIEPTHHIALDRSVSLTMPWRSRKASAGLPSRMEIVKSGAATLEVSFDHRAFGDLAAF